MSQFKKIGLIGRPGHAGVVDSLHRLLTFLKSRDVDIILDDGTGKLVPDHGQQVASRESLSRLCDLVVVVGGDGSMLNAAQSIASENVPVIGINRGRLGFLTDVLPEEIELRLSQVLAGEYSVESRSLLQLELLQDGERRHLGCALNDVVLHPGKAAQMIEFELFVDDRFVYSQESDGLIVATPTGSTAYAMSAGGPIMHPALNAIALVPICPHSLSSRPIVVGGDCEIRLVIGEKDSILPQVSCDGEVKFSAQAGDQLIVRKKAKSLRLIHPPDHSFYEAYRSKLGWGSRLERKDD
ncbi:MAG: NAD(+) kinase [Gammaproteobacteria bacterium]|nr:NAD(+) kinase [Pseudomonadales bacterium]